MTAVFVANGTAFGAWAGNIPRLRDQAGLTDASLGLVLLCVSIGALLAMQTVGRVAGRVGTARVCWMSALALMVALPLPAVAPGWLALLASGVVFGAALGSLDVAMNAHAAAFERVWGAAIMSSLHAGWSVGELGGAACAGLLAGVGLAKALAVPALGCAVFGLAAVILPEMPRAAPASARFAWPSSAMLGICAITAVSFAIEGGVGDWSGVYLRNQLGAPAGLASSSLSAFAAAMIAMRLFGDLAVRRLGAAQVIRWGSALAAAGLVGALASSNIWLAAAGFALVGVGVANTIPVLFSAAGRHGSTGVAMMATAGYGAAMAAPPLIGFVSHVAGLRTALLLLVAGAALIALLVRTGVVQAQPSPS